MENKDKKYHNRKFKKTKTRKENKNDKWKKLLSLVGDKVLELGVNVLERGVKEYAVEKINDTEAEVRKVFDQKFKEYKSKILQFGSILVGAVFVFYGILEVILMNFNLEKYTNLVFGLIFLGIAWYFNKK